MEDKQLKKILETLLFITDTPLPLKRLAQLCDTEDTDLIKKAVTEIREEYDKNGNALQIMQVAGGWQMATRSEYGLWVRKLYNNKMTVRLTQAALETLCIVAYKQPLTRAEVEAIRGVDSIGPLETLTQRKLITVVGRREALGRPILYGTTTEFLRQFALNSLDDLPKLDSFNIENPALAAQSTAAELADEDLKSDEIEQDGEPNAGDKAADNAETCNGTVPSETQPEPETATTATAATEPAEEETAAVTAAAEKGTSGGTDGK